ncbi:MAG: hypothetical protein HWE22_18995 [Flavobacteriales bacterium]|nr:hypothetical protein [Flavobacteriales bacterium]
MEEEQVWFTELQLSSGSTAITITWTRTLKKSIENFGLEKEKIIESLTDTDLEFDYILSHNVIEHVIDPIKFTTDLIGKLHPGG